MENTYSFAKIDSEADLFDLFRLRYQVYKACKLSGFVETRDDELDVDSYDFCSHHFGLFQTEDETHRLVGCMCIVDDNANIKTPLINFPNDIITPELFNQSRQNELTFPCINSVGTQALQQFHNQMRRTQQRGVEGSRLVILPSISTVQRQLLFPFDDSFTSRFLFTADGVAE